ncbi:neuropeptides capa receptor-like [Amphiura filiformis]|uniref:neuropeptides capa receptor-like n=1 Tax=Amphiura filiformis TaxID=82378 RepID=UPI003B2282BE
MLSTQNNETTCIGFPWLNLSLEYEAQKRLMSEAEINALLSLPILLIIGIVGNTAFIYVVFKSPRLHTITNIYLVSLAVADILFVTVSIASYIWSYVNSPVRMDTPFKHSVGCSFLYMVTITCYLASILFVTLVTFERYYAICYPLKHRKINTKSRTYKFVVFTWIFSLGISACVTPRYGKMIRFCVLWPDVDDYHNFPTEIGFCDAADPKTYLIGEVCQGVQFIFGLIINLFMYIRITQALGRRTNNLKTMTRGMSESQTQALQVRNQVARLLIINGVLYFICQAGLRIVSLDDILKHTGEGFLTEEASGIALIISRFLLYFNSVVNPFVYNLTSSFYRQAFIDVFCCRSRRDNGNDNLTVSKSRKETSTAL